MNAIVRGRVQGVGFRDATARTARRLGIRGWVRNRADGSVEVLAEGDGQALGQLEAFLRTGPRFAEVTDLELSWPVGAGQDDAAATDQRQNQDQDQRPDPEDFRIYF